MDLGATLGKEKASVAAVLEAWGVCLDWEAGMAQRFRMPVSDISKH